MNKSKIRQEYIRLRKLIMALGWLMPGLMARQAYKLWCKTRRVATPKEEFDFIEKSQRQTIQLEGIPLKVYCWGEGPRILLVHGWNGRAGQFLQLSQALVAAGFSVIGFDAPGHGESGGEKTNIMEISKVIRTLQARFGPFHSAISHSFGSSCVFYALRKQKLFEKLICIAPSVFFERRLDWFIDALSLSTKVEKRFRAIFADVYGADWQKALSAIHFAPTISLPTLIIHDADDRVISLNEARALARMLPNAELKITQRLGHWRLVNAPETIESVVAFCQSAKQQSLETA